MFYTYAHYRLDTNEIFYIGKGKGERYKSNRRTNPLWNNIAKKYGWYPKIMTWHTDEKAAFKVEQTFISALGRRDLGTGVLCNMTEGGEGSSGHKKSLISRTRMSASIKKTLMSPEIRAKISAIHKGRILSPERRALCGIANKGNQYCKGRIVSLETRAKMSASHQGVKKGPHSAETRAKISAARQAQKNNKTSIIEVVVTPVIPSQSES